MKKRVFCLLLAAVTLFSLLPAVHAEGVITRLEIWVASPIGGEIPATPEVIVRVKKDGSTFTLSGTYDYTASFSWREKGQSGVFTGEFESGEEYEVTVTLNGLLGTHAMDADVELLINGEKEEDRSVLSVKQDDAILTIPFTALSGDITPAVSVSADEDTEKEYDGRNLTLTATVTNPMYGVSYSYQWFRDGEAIPDATGKKLDLRNVADSGEYSCEVTAASTGETKVTHSLGIAVKIKPHPITIVLEDAEKNDGDPDPKLTYTVMGDGYDYLEGEPTREEGEAEGEYEITIGTLGFPEDVAGNYEITALSGRFTIAGTGVVTFAALSDVADLSYVVGKNSSHVRVSATKNALPKDAFITLSTVDDRTAQAFRDAAGEKGVMKSLSVSVTEGENANAELNKNAVLRLMIPLTAKEERYEASTLTALFKKTNGDVTSLELRREENVSTNVVYLVAEIRSPGSIALLNGELLPEEEQEEKDEAPAARKGSILLWILIVLITAGALGVIVWLWIRCQTDEAPTKTYTPQSKRPRPAQRRPAPPPQAHPAPPEKKEPPRKRVISFEELEEEEDD